MIDFTKYTGQELRAIVDVLDALTYDLLSSDITESFSIPMREYRRAQVALRTTIEIEAADHAAAEAEKVDRIVQARVAGAPPAEGPEGLQAVVDALSWCSNRLAALALAEDKHFAEDSQMDTFIKLTVLRNANRSIIDLLADIRDHYDGLH